MATAQRGLGSVLTLMVLALIGTACAGTPSSAPPATGPVVLTDAGPLRGTAADGVDGFRGVPYAAPPVGELRWAPPVPPAPWTEERAATSFGSPCATGDSSNGPRSEIEDCLFLNVWRPAGLAPGERRPVFVFIHGGALLNGSSAQVDGTELTRAGGVVTISLNYRLGQFGFMAHPLLTAAQGESGNYGLLDQQEALRWVQRNIAAFGGDPARVTIGGESAGAWSVCAHLVAPGSRGLFGQAVLQSGSCPSWSQAESEENGISVATALDCPTIDCLRDVSVAELMDAPAVGLPEPVRGTPFLPVDPDEAVRSGQFARVPVLVGSNRDEGRTFAAEYLGYTADQYGAWARKLFGPNADAVLARYPWPNPADQFSAPYQMGAILTDSGLFGIGGCANRALTRAFAQHTATWAYEFDHRAGPGLTPNPAGYEWGAGHAAELAYLFPSFDNGTPIAPTFDADEQRLAEEMKRSWTAFTSGGDPRAAGLPDWPRYEADGNALAWRAGGRSEVITDAQLAAGHQCDFWDSLPRQG